MKYLKNILSSFIYITLTILFLVLLLTILSYFNIINDKIVSIFKIIIPITGLFIGGIKLGKSINKKGYLEGIKLGIIFSIFLIIFNFLVFSTPLKIKYLLFYFILILSSMIGSMIGVNKNKG